MKRVESASPSFLAPLTQSQVTTETHAHAKIDGPDAASFSVVVYELRWACPYCRYCPLYTPDRKWASLFLLQVLPPSEHL